MAAVLLGTQIDSESELLEQKLSATLTLPKGFYCGAIIFSTDLAEIFREPSLQYA